MTKADLIDALEIFDDDEIVVVRFNSGSAGISEVTHDGRNIEIIVKFRRREPREDWGQW